MSIFLLGTIATIPMILATVPFACSRRPLLQRKKWAMAMIIFGAAHGAFHFGLSLEMSTPQPLWHLLVGVIRA